MDNVRSSVGGVVVEESDSEAPTAVNSSLSHVNFSYSHEAEGANNQRLKRIQSKVGKL